MRAIVIFFALLPYMPVRGQHSIPHLQKQGAITRLIVNDKPFLVLGGEL